MSSCTWSLWIRFLRHELFEVVCDFLCIVIRGWTYLNVMFCSMILCRENIGLVVSCDGVILIRRMDGLRAGEQTSTFTGDRKETTTVTLAMTVDPMWYLRRRRQSFYPRSKVPWLIVWRTFTSRKSRGRVLSVVSASSSSVVSVKKLTALERHIPLILMYDTDLSSWQFKK